MSTKLSFDSVVDLVLSGQCGIDTVEGVEPWPTAFMVCDSQVSVLMHRDLPGAVALFGVINGDTVLTGCFSGRLKDFIAERHAKHFRFDSCPSPEMAIRTLFKYVIEMQEVRKHDAAWRFICGVDGADLLASLRQAQASANVVN